MEERIGYHFDEFHLLKNAMTHSSYVNENICLKLDECNERLEFLGDAVLEIVSSDFLFHEHTEMPEGQLTKLRAAIWCAKRTWRIVQTDRSGRVSVASKARMQPGGRERSIHPMQLGSIDRTVYLDGWFANAKSSSTNLCLTTWRIKSSFYDSKTILQEIVQAKYSESMTYHLLGVRKDRITISHSKCLYLSARKEYGIGCGG